VAIEFCLIASEYYLGLVLLSREKLMGMMTIKMMVQIDSREAG